MKNTKKNSFLRTIERAGNFFRFFFSKILFHYFVEFTHIFHLFSLSTRMMLINYDKVTAPPCKELYSTHLGFIVFQIFESERKKIAF